MNRVQKFTAITSALVLLQTGTQHAAAAQTMHAAGFKSMALHVADIKHLFGSGFTEAPAYRHRGSDITCHNLPTSDYVLNLVGPVATHGVMGVATSFSKYANSAGARCNMAYDIAQRKASSALFGERDSNLTGIGDRGILIRLDPRKNEPGRPVWDLSARFIRGKYLIQVIVTSNKNISDADVKKLAAIVDGRVKHDG